MLIILAGITLNAVIGENGIIFQAKDTKNLVDNETKYDNEQLASLQNELKDNQLYSGIGIIPGTDSGGSSEGGENGTSGNQGGSQGNTGSNRINTQDPNPGGGTLVDGKTDEDPKILVTAGEAVAASFYQTDVTIQIYTKDRSKKIKYILSTTVTAITDELYPSGLVRELDIENGGTLTFTKDGEYTITAYAYDTQGNKSNPTIMWFKRQSSGTTTDGIAVTVASGKEGQNGWYTSNVTLRVLGTNTGSSEVRYRVQGTATGSGMIGDIEVEAGSVDTREVKIANGTTFKITADGNYSITAYDYDALGARISSSEVLNVKRDATRPVVKTFTGEQIVGTGFKVTVDAIDVGAGLVTNPYSYKHRLSETNGEFTSEISDNNTKTYAGLNQQKTYDMYVAVTDQAGNTGITDIIVKPALYVSSGTAGETSNEGARSYYRSNITMTLRGQDSNNADISKTTYQIIGTVTEAEENDGIGSIDGLATPSGTVLPANEVEITNQTPKTVQLQANGDWTVKVNCYNKGNKLVATNIYEITRDITVPTIVSITKKGIGVNSLSIQAEVNNFGVSGQETGAGYSFYLNTEKQISKSSNTHSLTGIPWNTRPNVIVTKVATKDKAGNTDEMIATFPIMYTAEDFSYTGNIIKLNSRNADMLMGETWGAQGGTNFNNLLGGKGAYAFNAVEIQNSPTINIVVGGKGYQGDRNSMNNGGGGGGGGSFIWLNEDEVLAVAGGGGGTGATEDDASIGSGVAGNGSTSRKERYTRFIKWRF